MNKTPIHSIPEKKIQSTDYKKGSWVDEFILNTEKIVKMLKEQKEKELSKQAEQTKKANPVPQPTD